MRQRDTEGLCLSVLQAQMRRIVGGVVVAKVQDWRRNTVDAIREHK